MKNANVLTALALAAIVAGIVVTTGCETQSASEKISVTPNSATVKVGESISFTGGGGFDYTWTLSNSALGSLSTSRGATTVYTSRNDPGVSNTVQQVLTLTSTIDSFSGTASNAANPFTQSVDAIITHLGSDPNPTPGRPNVFITPSSALLEDVGDQVRLRASGGSDFTWDLSNESIGTLSTRVGRDTIYRVLQAGNATNTLVQTVTVTDETGAQFDAIIKH